VHPLNGDAGDHRPGATGGSDVAAAPVRDNASRLIQRRFSTQRKGVLRYAEGLDYAGQIVRMTSTGFNAARQTAPDISCPVSSAA